MLNNLVSILINKLFSSQKNNPSNNIKKSKNHVIEVAHDFTTNPFYNLKSLVPFSVKFIKSSENVVIIKAEEHIQNFIALKVSNNTLIIDTNNSFSTNKPITIIVKTEFLNKVELFGAGDILLNDIANTSLSLILQGSGDIEATGTSANTQIKLIGSGNVNCKKLISTKARAELLGSGDILVHSTTFIENKLNGSGDIQVFGNPQIRDNVKNGSGDITFYN